MKKKKLQYRILLAVCALVALSVLLTSSPKKIRRYSQSGFFFGTEVQVDVCYGRDQKEKVRPTLKDVWSRWEDIHYRMNVYDNFSDVAKVNNSFRKPARVGWDTYFVLQEAIRFSQLTSGAFDITVWPLLSLWRESAQKNQLPSNADLAKVRKAVGVRQVRLLPNFQVKVLNKETKVDLGGIAAGYAADEAARILRQHGFENFLVDAGGDLYAGGINCDGEAWRIAVRDPADPSRIMEVVHISDLAVSTSGNYQQTFEIQGEKFTHIIDPATGYPEKKVASATIIAPTALEADAMATALCVLDPARGQQLIDRFGEDWASMVLTQEQGQTSRFESKNYPRYKLPPESIQNSR